MSKRILQISSFTPAQQADGVLAAASYAALKAGSATDILKIGKVLLEGQAASSAVTATCLARSSVLGVAPTALALPNTDATVNIAATVATTLPVSYVATGTSNPNRSPAVTIARLNLTFNAFGGILQWQTNPGSEEEWVSVGVATTSNSETVLSSANVGTAGLIGANIFYEVL